MTEELAGIVISTKVEVLDSMKATLRALERADFLISNAMVKNPDLEEARTLILGATCRMDADIVSIQEEL
jgi:hypothetical protein